MRTALKNIFHRATRHSLSARTPPSARRRPSPNVESLEPRYALDAVPIRPDRIAKSQTHSLVKKSITRFALIMPASIPW